VEGKRIRTDETPLLAGFRISVGQNTPTSRLRPHIARHLRYIARSRGQTYVARTRLAAQPSGRMPVGGGSSATWANGCKCASEYRTAGLGLWSFQ
jgi:hypothetical protein